MIIILLFFVGFLGGTVGSLAGLGGGIIIVPALLFLEGNLGIHPMGPQMIVGTSTLVLLFTGLSSTLAYFKQRKVDFKSGLIFFVGSGPGAYVGAIINRYINVEVFSIVFGFIIILIAIVMMVTKNMKPVGILRGKNPYHYTDETGVVWEYGFHKSFAIILCFFIGMLSGLFGIGGGSLMVPLMLLIFGFPPAIAIATSMFMVFLSAIISSVTHIALGNVDWLYGLVLIPGAWFGAKLGSYLNKKLNVHVVMLIFRLLLILVGVRLILSSIS